MRRVLATLLLASLTLLTACREAKVTSYRVPKEKPEELPPGLAAASTNAGTAPIPGAPAPAAPGMPGAPMVPGSDMASTAVPTANGSDLSWTAPADWKPKAPGAMRKGSFTVSGAAGDADLSITAFPGDVGGELANLNRWRGQIQLAPLAEGDLATVTTHLEAKWPDLRRCGLHEPVCEPARAHPRRHRAGQRRHLVLQTHGP